MIFLPNLVEWNGKSCAFIVALRGDKDLYNQVLELFYKNNTYVLHAPNEWSFANRENEAIETVRKLKIKVK
jgi:hypothetical protein